MSDIVERLRKLGGDTVGNYGMPIAHEAADELEHTSRQLAITERLLAESQARENEWRESVLGLRDYIGDDWLLPVFNDLRDKLWLPPDSTALDAAIAKAKREGGESALLDAAQRFSGQTTERGEDVDAVLLGMADELKGGEQ